MSDRDNTAKPGENTINIEADKKPYKGKQVSDLLDALGNQSYFWRKKVKVRK